MGHLAEDHYRVVQDALFEKQEQDEQPQLLLEQEDPNRVTSLSISFLLSISHVFVPLSFHASSINKFAYFPKKETQLELFFGSIDLQKISLRFYYNENMYTVSQ